MCTVDMHIFLRVSASDDLNVSAVRTQVPQIGFDSKEGELVVIREGKKAPRCGHMMHEGDTLQAETWEFRSLLNIM